MKAITNNRAWPKRSRSMDLYSLYRFCNFWPTNMGVQGKSNSWFPPEVMSCDITSIADTRSFPTNVLNNLTSKCYNVKCKCYSNYIIFASVQFLKFWENFEIYIRHQLLKSTINVILLFVDITKYHLRKFLWWVKSAIRLHHLVNYKDIWRNCWIDKVSNIIVMSNVVQTNKILKRGCSLFPSLLSILSAQFKWNLTIQEHT